AGCAVLQQNVEHVAVAGESFGGRLRQGQASAAGERRQAVRIRLAECEASCVDVVGAPELGMEKSADQLAWQVGGADVDPRILVHLPAEELRPVRALLADDLRPLDVALAVDE